MNTLNGTAAGAADGIFQLTGMLTAFQNQGGSALQHLGGIGLCLGTGQSIGHTAVGKGFHKQIGKGGAAAGYSAACVDQMLRQSVQQTALKPPRKV